MQNNQNKLVHCSNLLHLRRGRPKEGPCGRRRTAISSGARTGFCCLRRCASTARSPASRWDATPAFRQPPSHRSPTSSSPMASCRKRARLSLWPKGLSAGAGRSPSWPSTPNRRMWWRSRSQSTASSWRWPTGRAPSCHAARHAPPPTMQIPRPSATWWRAKSRPSSPGHASMQSAWRASASPFRVWPILRPEPWCGARPSAHTTSPSPPPCRQASAFPATSPMTRT